MKKRLSALAGMAGAMLSGLLMAAEPAFADPILVKFSHVVAPDTPKGRAVEKFKELAEERTGGRVTVEIHPRGELYRDKEELAALQIGAVQMLAPSLAKFSPLGIREFEVFDLPYIFPNKEVLRRVTEGPIGRELLGKLEAKGIIGLAYWNNGFKIMSANTPLILPGDMKGLTMRVQPSKVLESQMRALGADPRGMAFAMAREALQDGIVDGTENPPSNMLSQTMDAVQAHATVTNHGYLGYAVIVNRNFWNGLPPDIRVQLEGAVRDATFYADEIAQTVNDDALARMMEAGRTRFHEQSAEERQAWVDALLPVHKEAEARVGRELIRRIYKEAEAVGFSMPGAGEP